MTTEREVVEMVEGAGGKVHEIGALPDGSGFATASFPLRKDHWLFADDGEYEPAPMPMRMGIHDPRRKWHEQAIRAAARYAVRASTMKGRDEDFDPDALVQNMVTGMLGYFTPDGTTDDAWANPMPLPPVYAGGEEHVVHPGDTQCTANVADEEDAGERTPYARMWHGSYLSEDEIVAQILSNLNADAEAMKRWRDPESWRMSTAPYPELPQPNAGCLMFVGMSIRNHYGLWDDDNPYTNTSADPNDETKVKDGVIIDPLFPDNMAGRIIERVRAAIGSEAV